MATKKHKESSVPEPEQPRTADGPRPQRLGGPSRVEKLQRLALSEPAANRDGSRFNNQRRIVF